MQQLTSARKVEELERFSLVCFAFQITGSGILFLQTVEPTIASLAQMKH
jgi:hypothetical protein